MSDASERRYRISDVSKKTGVPQHVLRQWEARFPQLKPRRDRANRRYYLERDIAIVQRIKELVRHERLTTAGARVALSKELYGEGRPKTTRQIIALLEKIDREVGAALDILDSVKH